MKIIQIPYHNEGYFKEEVKKTQIYLHHTAGGPSASSVWKWWENDGKRIATCIVIDRNGTITQGFSSKYWAYHLGVKQTQFIGANIPYINLDKISIGIELCNWGQLTEKNGKFYNYVNSEVLSSDVIKLSTPHRGFEYFQTYTDKQIDAVKYLLLLWKDKYQINIKYNENIWDYNINALKGVNGLYTHNSVRKDKVDVYPYPPLIEMLKTLS